MDNLGGQILVGGVGMIALGVALLVALRLMQGPEEADRPNLLRQVQHVIAWMLLSMGMFGIVEAGFTLIQLLFLVAALVVVLPLALFRYFLSQRQSLLTLLAIAAEHNQPLAPAIIAFSSETDWLFETRIARIAAGLHAGESLSQAVQATPGWVLPRRARLLIQLGDRTGNLTSALVEAAQFREQEGTSGKWVSYFTYLMTLTFIGSNLLIFVMLKIVPAFQTIFEDFDAELPAMTQVLIDLSLLFASYWYLCSPLFLGLFVLFLYAMGRYTGWVDLDLPLVGRLFRRFDSANILRGLALVVESNRPLVEGVEIMARGYPRRYVRRRLANVLGEITLGVDWRRSLSAHGLITPADEGLLTAAEQAGNLAWAMRITADTAERRLAYRLHALLEIASPITLLLISLIVAFVVVALFLPLIKLIEQLT